MIVRGIVPGQAIPSPAYLDASILVSYFVRRTNSYAATQVIGELLAQRVEVILSPLTIAEFWWGIFDALYNRERLRRGETLQRLTAGEYRRHRQVLGAAYEAEVGLIRQQLKTWPNVRGIAFRSAGFRQWLASFDDQLDHLGLLPSDEAHLSLARRFAKTLITADRDFTVEGLTRVAFTIIVV